MKFGQQRMAQEGLGKLDCAASKKAAYKLQRKQKQIDGEGYRGGGAEGSGKKKAAGPNSVYGN